MCHQDVRKAENAGNRRDVTEKDKIELVVECRVDRRRRVNQEQRIAVRRRADDGFRADIVAAARRFSTTNWPSRSDSHVAMNRATMSFAPPGAAATMMRTGRVG